jgi:PhzF family phenazine biosynthesis protein
MELLRLAAFCDGAIGGNPAGVVIGNALPSAADMQRAAREIGYSETVFAARVDDRWRVRYFSPAAEVPFCGHATIALGAALALGLGDGRFPLLINAGEIAVEGACAGGLMQATLRSPPTKSAAIDADALVDALELFGLTPTDLDPRIPPATIHAGADHLLLMLDRRSTLAAMQYEQERGRQLMTERGWVTIMLAHAESAQRFHVRNAFAFGGIYEDPATGAAAAALGGYLRHLRWPHGGAIELHQGDDMGVPCRLRVAIGPERHSAVHVSGAVRRL